MSEVVHDDRAFVFDQILSMVQERWVPGRPFTLFVSGVDGAGKTSFVAALAREAQPDVQLVHLDDFHHPRRHRYTGGHDAADRYYNRSFDFDRIVSEVLHPIDVAGSLDTTLSVVDLASDAPTARRSYRVRPGTLVVVEGVFLARPELRGFCDAFVQLEVPMHVAFDRVLARDASLYGGGTAERYAKKYFPAQLRYQRELRPAERADVTIDNRDPARPRLIRPVPARHLEVNATEIDAVCFDLWNTLVPLPAAIKEESTRLTAAQLGVGAERFRRDWRSTRRERETTDLAAFLRVFCSGHGIAASERQVRDVLALRARVHGQAIAAPREDALLTLLLLRAAGKRLGMISNCTSDVAGMLAGGALLRLLDAAVYSFEEGVMKPDPAIYRRACQRLGVTPDRCLYVGDGSDDELHGAAASGMRPVLLETGEPREHAGARVDALLRVAEALV